MRRIEHLLVGLDDKAAGAILRVAVGYATGTVWLLVMETRAPGWTVVPFFLAVLALLRVVPALVRRVCRFSEPVRRVWAERRQMAKRFDSYQWQKLLWIGLGLLLHAGLAARRSGALLALALVCVVAGLLGLAAWRSMGPGVPRGGSNGSPAAASEKGREENVTNGLTLGSTV